MKKRISLKDLNIRNGGSIPLNGVAGSNGHDDRDEATKGTFCQCTGANDCHTMLYTNCDCDQTERAGMSCVACETGQGCQSGYCPHTVSQQMICCALTDDKDMCVVQTRGVTCIQPVTDACADITDGCPALSDNPPCVHTELCAQSNAYTDC